MDIVGVEDFKNRLTQLGLRSGATGLPRKRVDRQILFQSVVLTLSPDAEYTEKEIDAALEAWLEDVAPSIDIDHVALRRYLVDDEFLGRAPDGSAYSVLAPGSRRIRFAPEVKTIDVREVIADAKRQRAEQKIRARREGHSPSGA
jgi:hypothetical protein